MKHSDKIKAAKAAAKAQRAGQTITVGDYQIVRCDAFNWQIQKDGKGLGFYGTLPAALEALPLKALNEEAKDGLKRVWEILGAIREDIQTATKRARIIGVAALLLIVPVFSTISNAQSITPSNATTAPVGVGSAITEAIIAVATNMDAGTEFAVNVNGQYGQEIGQSIALFGSQTSNTVWSVGLHHATFFVMGTWGKGNSSEWADMLGIKARYGWEKCPAILKYAMFNANHVSIDLGCDYPTTDWVNAHFACGHITPYIGISRTFGP